MGTLATRNFFISDVLTSF